MILWLGTLAAAGSWDVSFHDERRRVLAEGPRVVLVVGRALVPAATSLCEAVADAASPCAVHVLPGTARRDAGVTLAASEQARTVYVMRAAGDGVRVALFDAERALVDEYAVRPGQTAPTAVGQAALVGRIGRLEARVDALSRATAPLPTAAEEEAADAILEAAVAASARLDPAAALEHLRALDASWPATRANRLAERLRAEVGVIGRPAVPLDRVDWIVGAPVAGGSPTLVVVFEPWCPHSREALGTLQRLYTALGGEGLRFAGVTPLTRGSTTLQVRELADAVGITFPLGRLPDDVVTAAYDIVSVPSGVLVDRGQVVWRGHPGTLDAASLRRWLRQR